MSGDDLKKISGKTRSRNRGSSTLNGVDYPLAPSIDINTQPDPNIHKERIESLFREEAASPEITALGNRIRISEALTRKQGKSPKARIYNTLRLVLRPAHKVFAFIFAPWVGKQEKFNAQAVAEFQRLINFNKNCADLLSDKIARLENKHDLLIMEIVSKYLVRFTADLVTRMDLLYRRLDENFIAHDLEIERHTTNLRILNENSRRASAEIKEIEALMAAQRREFERIFDATRNEAEKNKVELEKAVSSLSDIDYYLFENRFRGDEKIIAERQAKYVDYFKNAGLVLDIACGRGEFLESLKKNGINAEGVDLNSKMVEVCRDKGLAVQHEDVLVFLNGTSKKYDGIFCSNLIEHLSYSQQRELIAGIRRVLNKNGVVILETVNPESLNTFAGAMYLDLTHKRPLHPLGLQALLESFGFSETEIIRFSQVEDEAKLEDIDVPEDLPIEQKRVFASLNRNMSRLNNLLYNYQEYGIIGIKKE